jgi:serine/threonine protein kinase
LIPALSQVHRDVKSENILIDADGYCLLADMGLAAFCAPESDQTRDVKGQSSTWHSPPIGKRENHLINPKEGQVVRANR